MSMLGCTGGHASHWMDKPGKGYRAFCKAPIGHWFRRPCDKPRKRRKK